MTDDILKAIFRKNRIFSLQKKNILGQCSIRNGKQVLAVLFKGCR